jgi:hypothetical protein
MGKNIATKQYKDHYYGRNSNGVWIVLPKGVQNLNDSSGFIVALDDSKMDGPRKGVKGANSETKAKEYIDWLTRK